ncbi:hypothetical protein GINT2_000503 [Glugoides intestinalis]
MESKRSIRTVEVIFTGNNSTVYYGFLLEYMTDRTAKKPRKHSKKEIAEIRKCYIKRYHGKYTSEFLRETEILKVLNHLNVIKPVFFGKTRSYAMEFGAKPLRSFIESKSLSNEKAIEFSSQIANALSYLQSNKIVHFDLKPENIVVYEETIKLIDFGAAKYENEKIVVHDTTASYTSLEYLLGLQTAHSFKDVWSFGCIFYELLCFKQLVDSDRAISAVSSILKIFGLQDKSIFLGFDIKHLTFFNIFGDSKSTEFDFRIATIRHDLQHILRRIFEMNPSKRITAIEIKKSLTAISAAP